MPVRVRKHRLAQSHKLNALSDQLSRVTNFTADEVRVLIIFHQKLEELGPLDRNRFREILCVVFAITDDIMLDLLMKAFDKDNDGYINDIEWIKGLSAMMRGTLDQLIDFVYSVYDMNGDDSLAREELLHCLKGCIYAGYGVEDDEVEECEREIVDIALKKLDTDRDGQITYPDFNRAVKNDALLLQACGVCLPTGRLASAFQSLFTENYVQGCALFPNMPSSWKEREHVKKNDGKKHVSTVVTLNKGERHSEGKEAATAANQMRRASKVLNPDVEMRLRNMSLSVVKTDSKYIEQLLQIHKEIKESERVKGKASAGGAEAMSARKSVSA